VGEASPEGRADREAAGAHARTDRRRSAPLAESAQGAIERSKPSQTTLIGSVDDEIQKAVKSDEELLREKEMYLKSIKLLEEDEFREEVKRGLQLKIEQLRTAVKVLPDQGGTIHGRSGPFPPPRAGASTRVPERTRR
jgi:hypothetical protein